MVGSTTNRISFNVTSASTAPLSVTYRFDDPSWLQVTYVETDSPTIRTLVSGTDYTPGGDGETITGTVTLTDSFLETIISGVLVIARFTPALQELDLQYNTRFPSELTEKQLDWIVMALQDRSDSSTQAGTRAIVLPPNEPTANTNTLQVWTDRAGKLQYFNASTGAITTISIEDIAPLILAYYDGIITAEDVLAAISAIAPLERFTPPTTSTLGKFGQLAIIPEHVDLVITGTLSPDITGTILPWKTQNGKIWFSTGGVDPETLTGDAISVLISWTGAWIISVYEFGVVNVSTRWASFPGSWLSDPYPNNVGTWIPIGATGQPSIATTNAEVARVWVNMAPTDTVPNWRGIPHEEVTLYISGLREFTGDDISIARIQHHSVMEDAGSGDFIWIPDSIQDDDNGTVIKPTSISSINPGRWHRIDSLQNPGTMNVSWFGAVAFSQTLYGPSFPEPDDVFDSIDAFQAANDALPKADPSILTTTGRHWRTGTIIIPSGQFWLSETFYVSPTVKIQGAGTGRSILLRMHNTADFSEGEKWMIMSEEVVPTPLDNNNFSNTIEGLTVIGNSFVYDGGGVESENGNGGISGILWRGAQGSYADKIIVTACGIRGFYLPAFGVCNISNLWVNNITRGPGLHLSGFSNGSVHSNLSIEHVNQDDLYDLAGHAGIPTPAVFMESVSGTAIIMLQGENSSLELFMNDCSDTRVAYFTCDGDLISTKSGVIINGNSANNAFGPANITDAYSLKFQDLSDIQVANGTSGTRNPLLFNGTTLLNPLADITTNAAKLALQNPKIGQVFCLTSEGSRCERYIGGDSTTESSWEKITGTYNLSINNGFATSITVNGVSISAGGTTSVGWVAEGQVLSLSGAAGLVTANVTSRGGNAVKPSTVLSHVYNDLTNIIAPDNKTASMTLLLDN